MHLEIFFIVLVEHKLTDVEIKTKYILCASEKETPNYSQALNNGKLSILKNINFYKTVPNSYSVRILNYQKIKNNIF